MHDNTMFDINKRNKKMINELTSLIAEIEDSKIEGFSLLVTLQKGQTMRYVLHPGRIERFHWIGMIEAVKSDLARSIFLKKGKDND
jgi:hypothetical protein